MSNMLRQPPLHKSRTPELTFEERHELNTIIDHLIPADKDFPPPSTLPLIDAFLSHLVTSGDNKVTRMVNMQQLRSALHELNAAAGGCFCDAGYENQRILLRHFERHNPAFFQELWTLANHSYYTHMAVRWPISPQALS